MRGFFVTAFACAVVAVVAGCPSSDDPSAEPRGFKCAQGSTPCGNGCMPNANNNVCCEFNGSLGSSYCTSGSCFENVNERCGDAAYCCAPNGSFASADCPEGQKHCGLGCVPRDQPCCREGQTCANAVAWDPLGCTVLAATATGCAVCLDGKRCLACPGGSCCKGDPCAGGGCAACPVHGTSGGSSSGGSSSGGSSGTSSSGGNTTKGLCASTCTTCSGVDDPKCDALGGTCCGTAPNAYCTDLTVSGCFPCDDDSFCLGGAKCCKPGTGGGP